MPSSTPILTKYLSKPTNHYIKHTNVTHMNQNPKRQSDLSPAELIELALIKEEGKQAENGALCITTGARTGRSQNDRFIVDESSTNDLINWGELNRPFPVDKFDALWELVEDEIHHSDHYVNQLELGCHPDYYIPVKVTTQTASHALFAHNILSRPEQFNKKGTEKWRLLHAANFICQPERDGTNSDATVIICFSQRKILIAGMHYGGELKKALFTVQNFLLPEKDVLPMHCSANVGNKEDVTLIFGLSGTGKTTLSADPNRKLIGDDEHGWGKDTVFNFEGGCYAKTLNLSRETQPVIWDAIRFGAILENVVINPENRTVDYANTQLSENGRACYPLEHISNCHLPPRSGEPNALIFLTCDVLGVLPPIARLSPQAAAYYFISGYSAKIASTESEAGEGISSSFSACYGAPFMPRFPTEYTRLLIKKIEESKCKTYLLNSGWYGGGIDSKIPGKRFSIDQSRTLITAIQEGTLDEAKFEKLPIFNLEIPQHLPGFDTALLDPRTSWKDKKDYNKQANYLAKLFEENIKQFSLKNSILEAGPQHTPR